MFDAGTKMVFIMAGLGGGTGTGVAPVIARVAKDMGILTIGVVTLPFVLEGKKRIEKALAGMEKMRENVDSLLVINNEKLIDMYGDSDMTWDEGMEKADEVLTIATKTVSEIITVMGKVNRDFEDINTVMRNGGSAIVSVAKASGEQRIFKAMSAALDSPLLNNIEKKKAKKLLYVIYSGKTNPARVGELKEINSFMENFNDDIEILWGHYPDDELDDEIKVAVIATGFDVDEAITIIDEQEDRSESLKQLREKFYPSRHHTERPQPAEAAEEEKEEENEFSSEASASFQAPSEPEPEPEPIQGSTKSLLQKIKDRLYRLVDE